MRALSWYILSIVRIHNIAFLLMELILYCVIGNVLVLRCSALYLSVETSPSCVIDEEDRRKMSIWERNNRSAQRLPVSKQQ